MIQSLSSVNRFLSGCEPMDGGGERNMRNLRRELGGTFVAVVAAAQFIVGWLGRNGFLNGFSRNACGAHWREFGREIPRQTGLAEREQNRGYGRASYNRGLCRHAISMISGSVNRVSCASARTAREFVPLSADAPLTERANRNSPPPGAGGGRSNRVRSLSHTLSRTLRSVRNRCRR